MAGAVIQGRFGAGGAKLPGVLGGLTANGPGHVRVVMASGGHGSGHPGAQQLPSGLIRPGGGGRPLPERVRGQMESFFGTDFSDVRVHVGSEAASIGALAFTMGSSLYFAPGQYNPDSPQGLALLGHELTHVVQQRQGRVRNPFGSGIAVVQDLHLEAEADRMGARAANHRVPQPVQAKPAPGLVPRGAGVPRPVQPKAPKAPDAGGYRLIVGGYLHQEKGLPDGMAGHGFVAIEKPGGGRQAFGFSPAGFSNMDARRDLGKLTAGVPGRVHDDASAFTKPGVRTRSFAISREQAEQAMGKVAEYRKGTQFSLARKQCSSFAMDVARAAGVDDFAGAKVKSPREWYRKI